MIKAVAFDLWETLITNSPEISDAQKRLRVSRMESVLVAHGHAAEAEKIEHAHRMVWERCHDLYWSGDRDISCRRQVEVFLEELGVDAAKLEEETLVDLEDAYARAAVERLPEVVSGAREVVSEVKQRGLRTGLISNTGRTPGYALREILAALRIASSIDVMVFSNEHGECKPKPSIFEALRKGLDVPYEHIVFVGDNLYVDVLGAQRLGMRAVHFVPAKRGTAVAPHVEHEPIEPDGVITALRELPDVLRKFELHG